MQVGQDGVLHGQEINAAHSPHAQSGIQGEGCIGGPARRPYISARPHLAGHAENNRLRRWHQVLTQASGSGDLCISKCFSPCPEIRVKPTTTWDNVTFSKQSNLLQAICRVAQQNRGARPAGNTLYHYKSGLAGCQRMQTRLLLKGLRSSRIP